MLLAKVSRSIFRQHGLRQFSMSRIDVITASQSAFGLDYESEVEANVQGDNFVDMMTADKVTKPGTRGIWIVDNSM